MEIDSFLRIPPAGGQAAQAGTGGTGGMVVLNDWQTCAIVGFRESGLLYPNITTRFGVGEDFGIYESPA
jgi:hypothetical protein